MENQDSFIDKVSADFPFIRPHFDAIKCITNVEHAYL